MIRRRLGRAENSSSDEEQPLLDSIWMIQLQQAHSRSTAGGERYDASILKTKVVDPTITTRVEERHNVPALRGDGGQITPFEAIAERTGQREIAGFRGTAVFLGDDVVDFVRRECHRFRNQTILTAVLRAASHRAPQLGWDVRATHGDSLELSWSAAFAFAIRTRCSMY